MARDASKAPKIASESGRRARPFDSGVTHAELQRSGEQLAPWQEDQTKLVESSANALPMSKVPSKGQAPKAPPPPKGQSPKAPPPKTQVLSPPRSATKRLSDSSISDTAAPSAISMDWVEGSAKVVDAAAFEARYEQREALARGGMGEVQVLWDARIGREVAAKFMRTSLAQEAALRARFLREACLQGQLEHPSIVPVHDMGIAADGQPYFTMKRVRGMTLREVLNLLQDGDADTGARFSRRKLLSAFSSVCLTLAFAHERGVVHRDVKPANIMLGDFGETYLLDWGLAKYIGDPEHAPSDRSGENVVPTATGVVFGTPGYMAPEQLGGDSESLGPAIDVYALGAILFEILTLEPIAPGETRDEVIRATLSGVDARFSRRCPELGLPPELEAICVKATSFVPEHRFPSVRALNDAIERYLDGQRDGDHRAEMASRHAATAELAINAAAKAGTNEEEGVHRKRAMQELGRALALDAKNESATRSLLRLLLEPPREIPREAREQIEEARAVSSRQSARWGSIAYVSVLTVIPVLIAMGVRDWSFLGLAILLPLGLAGMSVVAAEQKRPAAWILYLRCGLSTLLCLVATKILGPLGVLPMLLFCNAIGYTLRPDPKLRTFTLALTGAVFFGTVGYELFRSSGGSYLFREGMMCILPDAVELAPKAGPIGLAFIFMGLIVMITQYIGRVFAHLNAAEERVHLYNWHLRQLLPQVGRERLT